MQELNRRQAMMEKELAPCRILTLRNKTGKLFGMMVVSFITYSRNKWLFFLHLQWSWPNYLFGRCFQSSGCSLQFLVQTVQHLAQLFAGKTWWRMGKWCLSEASRKEVPRDLMQSDLVGQDNTQELL